MNLKYEDLVSIATGLPGQGDHMIKALEAECVTLRQQVQNNKQIMSLQTMQTLSGIDKYRPEKQPTKINSKWTNEELLLAVQGKHYNNITSCNFSVCLGCCVPYSNLAI